MELLCLQFQSHLRAWAALLWDLQVVHRPVLMNKGFPDRLPALDRPKVKEVPERPEEYRKFLHQSVPVRTNRAFPVCHPAALRQEKGLPERREVTCRPVELESHRLCLVLVTSTASAAAVLVEAISADRLVVDPAVDHKAVAAG